MPSLGNDHFDTNLNAVHWGNFGRLNYYYSLLRQITDIAFSEGEFSK